LFDIKQFNLIFLKIRASSALFIRDIGITDLCWNKSALFKAYTHTHRILCLKKWSIVSSSQADELARFDANLGSVHVRAVDTSIKSIFLF